LVRRWQAARRQAKRRQAAEVKAQQAAAQRMRRQQAKTAAQATQQPEFAPARGHAAEIFFLSPCATAPAAMNLHRLPFATRQVLRPSLSPSRSQCLGP